MAWVVEYSFLFLGVFKDNNIWIQTSLKQIKVKKYSIYRIIL